VLDPIEVEAKRNTTHPVVLGIQWLTGMGPENQHFHGWDRATKELRTSPDLQRGRCAFAKKYNGEIPDGATFSNGSTAYGVDDYATSDTATEQYVGSFDYSFAAIGDGKMAVEAFNMSSVKSALAGRVLKKFTGVNLPMWGRGKGPFGASMMGNTTQNFFWVEPLPEACE